MTIGERIAGALVALAPLRPADAPLWERWLSDPVTTRYLYGRRGPPDSLATLAELRSWGRQALADPQLVAFGIEEVGEGTVIGNARLQLWAWGRARFSILIGEADHRGRGRAPRRRPSCAATRSSGSACARSSSTSTRATWPPCGRTCRWGSTPAGATPCGCGPRG